MISGVGDFGRVRMLIGKPVVVCFFFDLIDGCFSIANQYDA